jgi:hypothetical protein
MSHSTLLNIISMFPLVMSSSRSPFLLPKIGSLRHILTPRVSAILDPWIKHGNVFFLHCPNTVSAGQRPSRRYPSPESVPNVGVFSLHTPPRAFSRNGMLPRHLTIPISTRTYLPFECETSQMRLPMEAACTYS